MNKARNLATNLLTLSVAISIPLIVADQYFRLSSYPKNNARVMLLSGGNLNSYASGVRRYSPNSVIVHSAVYGEILEYSYEFLTDENGFRITYNCTSKPQVDNLVAIAGDSFTEGQGSNVSWIKNVQKQLCDQGLPSVNTAIAGHGLEDMFKSLNYAYHNLDARTAIVAIVPDDIYRPFAPMVSNQSCSMYVRENISPPDKNCGDSATWWHHPNTLNQSELVTFAKSKYNFGIMPVFEELISKVKPFVKGIFFTNRETFHANNRKKVIHRSISAMNSIVSTYGSNNVSLFILPTSNDRDLTGSLSVKARRSSDLNVFLESLDNSVSVKDLRNCPLDQRHFLKLDRHPNAKGHELLGTCAIS